MQRQEREGTGKVEGNIKLDLREQDWRPPGVEKGWGRGAPLSRGCPCAAPTGDRVPACSDYLKRDRACLKGDGLLLGVAGKAAGTLRSGFRRARLSLSAGCHALRHDGRVQPACSWTISQELGVGGGFTAALQGSGYSCSLCLYEKAHVDGCIHSLKVSQVQRGTLSQMQKVNKNHLSSGLRLSGTHCAQRGHSKLWLGSSSSHLGLPRDHTPRNPVFLMGPSQSTSPPHLQSLLFLVF